jgi:fatty-acyl-CoA synthase
LKTAAIEVPDPIWGESVMACIVVKSGHTVTEDEIIRHCKANIAPYKKPKHIRFLNELPKSPSGKILKRKLRDEFSRKGEINGTIIN